MPHDIDEGYNASDEDVYVVGPEGHYVSDMHGCTNDTSHVKRKRPADKGYDSVKRDFESTHFKCGSVFYTQSALTGQWKPQGKSDFITENEQTQYEELVFDKRSKKQGAQLTSKCFVHTWLKDEQMRIYAAAVCLPPPRDVPRGVFNLWAGFPATKVTLPPTFNATDFEQRYERIRDHLLAVAGDDPLCFEYLQNWVAWIIQMPGHKTGIMPIVRSPEKGVGKGVFGDILIALIGQQYCLKTDNPHKELFGNFNSALDNKLLVIFDESSQQVLSHMMEELKSKITEGTHNISRKFSHMEESSPSYLNFVMFTNRHIAWEHNDRRPLFLSMSARLKGNYDHHKAVEASLKDPAFMRYAFDKFAARDLTSFQLERDRPVTQLHRSMEARHAPTEVQFLIDFGFFKGRFNSPTTGKEFTTETCVSASDLYAEYGDFMKKHEYKVMTSHAFGCRMNDMVNDGIRGIRKRRTKRGYEYCIHVPQFKEWLKENNYWTEEGQVDDTPMERMIGYQATTT